MIEHFDFLCPLFNYVFSSYNLTNSKIILISIIIISVLTFCYFFQTLIFYVISGLIFRQAYNFYTNYNQEDFCLNNPLVSISKIWPDDEKLAFISESFSNYSYDHSKYIAKNIDINHIVDKLLLLDNKKAVLEQIDIYFSKNLELCMSDSTKIDIMMLSKQQYLYLNSNKSYDPNSINHNELFSLIRNEHNPETVRATCDEYFVLNFCETSYLNHLTAIVSGNMNYIIGTAIFLGISYTIWNYFAKDPIVDTIVALKEYADSNAQTISKQSEQLEGIAKLCKQNCEVNVKVVDNLEVIHEKFAEVAKKSDEKDVITGQFFEQFLELAKLSDKFQTIMTAVDCLDKLKNTVLLNNEQLHVHDASLATVRADIHKVFKIINDLCKNYPKKELQIKDVAAADHQNNDDDFY